MADILDGLGVGNYFDSEGVPTQKSQEQVQQFKLDTAGLDSGSKLQIKSLLSSVENYISTNRSMVQQQVDLLSKSEKEINKQLKDFDSDNTVSDLQKQTVASNVLNIAYISYSEYYSDMQELRYRLAIIADIKSSLKAKLKEYDDKMKTIQDYSDALTAP